MRNFLEAYPQGSGRGIFAPLVSDTVDARVLATNTAERHTIPTGANFVLFSGSADFYALFGTSGVTAAIPAADVTDGTAPEFKPAARRIPSGVTHISLIAPAAAVVTMAFWA